jgi:hypothetical protein
MGDFKKTPYTKFKIVTKPTLEVVFKNRETGKRKEFTTPPEATIAAECLKLFMGGDELWDAEDIAKTLGIPQIDVDKFLDGLVADGFLVETDEYRLD